MKTLPDRFFRDPADAVTTMTTKDLRELLLHTEGQMWACGHYWLLQSEHLGAGVYRVRLVLR